MHADLALYLEALTAVIRTCRAEGVSHFEGTLPPFHRHLVKLGVRPVAPPPDAPDQPVAPADPARAGEKTDPIDALNARLFGDPIPAKVNGA